MEHFHKDYHWPRPFPAAIISPDFNEVPALREAASERLDFEGGNAFTARPRFVIVDFEAFAGLVVQPEVLFRDVV
jgi:hypothetical protein